MPLTSWDSRSREIKKNDKANLVVFLAPLPRPATYRGARRFRHSIELSLRRMAIMRFPGPMHVTTL